jgi:hypothetical protein
LTGMLASHSGSSVRRSLSGQPPWDAHMASSSVVCSVDQVTGDTQRCVVLAAVRAEPNRTGEVSGRGWNDVHHAMLFSCACRTPHRCCSIIVVAWAQRRHGPFVASCRAQNSATGSCLGASADSPSSRPTCVRSVDADSHHPSTQLANHTSCNNNSSHSRWINSNRLRCNNRSSSSLSPCQRPSPCHTNKVNHSRSAWARLRLHSVSSSRWYHPLPRCPSPPPPPPPPRSPRLRSARISSRTTAWMLC